MIAYLTLMEVTALLSAATLVGLFVLVAVLLNRVVKMMDIAVDIVEDIRNDLTNDIDTASQKGDNEATR